MSPIITLSDETFSMLQALAQPFVDTPESVISVLAKAELERMGRTGSDGSCGRTGQKQVLRLSPDSHADLTHTRLLSATVDGRPIHRPKWNGLLDHLHILARQRLGSFDTLRRASGANIREGRYEEDGYRYLPEADLSIQGVDANLACDHSLTLARALKTPIQLRVEWRKKEGAAHPGEEATIEWVP
jgi:hypothetical protein